MLQIQCVWLAAQQFVHGFPAELGIYPQPFVELGDVLKIAPWAAFRHQLREWDVKQSDSPNMDTLYNPRICQPQLDHLGLMSPSCPLVLVMEELGRRDWRCQSDTRPLVPLLSPHAGVYALAMWNNRRLAYFQCLLALGELWGQRTDQVCPRAANRVLCFVVQKRHACPCAFECWSQYLLRGLGKCGC